MKRVIRIRGRPSDLRPIESKKQFKRLYPWLLGLFVLSLSLSFAWTSWGNMLFPKEDKNAKQMAQADDGTVPLKGRFLLLGVDEREEDRGRSDVMILVDLTGSLPTFTHIPRDTRIPVTGYGLTKINHAYAYGGERLAKEAVELLLGKKVDHTIVVTTQQFAKIIDAMGGVDIDIAKSMHYEDPWDDNGGLVINFEPGPQKLDGRRALEYARFRDGEGDIGRIERQKQVITQVILKMANPLNWPKLATVVHEDGLFHTDANTLQLLGAAKTLVLNHQLCHFETVPGHPEMINDISYWIADGESRYIAQNTLSQTFSYSTVEQDLNEFSGASRSSKKEDVNESASSNSRRAAAASPQSSKTSLEGVTYTASARRATAEEVEVIRKKETYSRVNQMLDQTKKAIGE